MSTMQMSPILSLTDLRERAAAVRESAPATELCARSAARCLSGIVALLSRRFGTDVAQLAAQRLAADDDAWAKRLAVLPAVDDARVATAIDDLATIARGVLPLAGADNLRAAVAWWGTERDPAQWQAVTAGRAA